MNAADAVYGFVAWLTTRDEATVFSAHNECSTAAELVNRFCSANNITPSEEFPAFQIPAEEFIVFSDNCEVVEQPQRAFDETIKGSTNELKKLDPKVRTSVQTEVETIVACELGGKEKNDVVWDTYLGKFVPKEQSEPKDIMLVSITTSFSAVHRWSKCPIEDVAFLREPHRHVFHVKMKFPVYHDDRDIEFIDMKNKVEAFITEHWDKKDLGDMSCEMMCKALALRFKAVVVGVSEDNENGAELIQEL